MRQSFMSIIFAAALLFKYDALSAGLAMDKAEGGSLEQEAFNSLLSDEATESSLSDVDLGAMIKARVPRVIVVAADPSIWRDLWSFSSRLPNRRQENPFLQPDDF
uniref:Melanin-concentrating hormone n=1 Tax=Nothobranchius furzeri TaxID=105023 RepID=A0A8C6KEW9_NOTFU